MALTAYLLIGDSNTRKSSLLRALTGCFNRSLRDIELRNGKVLRLYARAAALQESRTNATDFIAEVARSRCSAVAFALLPEANPTDPLNLPDAHAYLRVFASAGWQFERTALLGAHPIKPALAGTARFPSVMSQPINHSAQSVREHFGWK
jgi:hypothetical protein